jgi:hypothetical protein
MEYFKSVTNAESPEAAEAATLGAFLAPAVACVANLVDQVAAGAAAGIGSFQCNLAAGKDPVDEFTQCFGPLQHAVYALADIMVLADVFADVPKSCGHLQMLSDKAQIAQHQMLSEDSDKPRGRESDRVEVLRLVREVQRVRTMLMAAKSISS